MFYMYQSILQYSNINVFHRWYAQWFYMEHIVLYSNLGIQILCFSILFSTTNPATENKTSHDTEDSFWTCQTSTHVFHIKCVFCLFNCSDYWVVLTTSTSNSSSSFPFLVPFIEMAFFLLADLGFFGIVFQLVFVMCQYGKDGGWFLVSLQDM